MLWRPVLCLHSQTLLNPKTSGGGGLSEPIASESSSATSAEGAAESPNASDASQFSEQVPLDQPFINENQNENSPVQDAGSTGASNQIAGTVPLPEGSADAVASIVADGLVFEIDASTNTAKLVGSAVTPPKGDFSIPASVTSGSTTYEVTSIAKSAFAKCPELTSILLPATLREVDPDAVSGCSSLKSITVSTKNEAFASSDGMLFTKDYSRLLLIPEGKEGAATIPGQTTYVPAQAFSRCLSSSLTAGDGSAEFKTQNGMLFTKDLKTLVVCPSKVGNAVVLPTETETIGEYALAGCKDLTSITALGNVREIDPTAFAEEVKASAVVALPAGEDYEARKAVWEAANFQHFAEPAVPGATSRPEADGSNSNSEAVASGFVFTLLDDYTLSVAWEGVEDPVTEVEIPASAEINGVSYRVSTIATNAFANHSSLASMKLPESITSIGEAAFAGCANLTTIQLPDTLRELGERAFEATGLTDIWLPASVQSIAPRAFASCESLTRIVALGIPEVADDALAACANLSLYCPYSAEGAYPWNLGLIANNNHLLPYGLDLPEEPLHLEVGQSANLFEGALNEAPEPCEVSYSYAAKPISVAPDGTVSAKAPGTSEVTATLTLNNQELSRATRTVVVSASSEPVTQSGSEESEKQESSEFEEPLKGQIENAIQAPVTEPSIALSNGLDPTTISLETGELVNENGMIQRAAMLATGESFEQEVASGHTLKFTVLSEAEGEMSGEVAVSKSANAALDPRGALVVPATVENNGSKYQVTAIADNGFSASFYLSSISFAEGSTLSSLGSASFNNCRSLSQVSLPNSVKNVGASAFTNCTSLTDIDLSSADTIGKESFLTCTSLSSVALGAGVTVLPTNLFSNCRSLRTIYAYGNVSSFEDGVFDLLSTQEVSVYAFNADGVASWLAAASAAGHVFKTVEVIGERCSVTFDSQGGLPATFVQTVAKGVPIAEPSSPVRDGFSLSGWFTSNGDRWDFSQPIENNITLYGQWVEEATDGTFLYRMRSDGKGLSVTAINPSALTGHVVIPSEYKLGGSVFPVEEVAQFALYRSRVGSLFIPKSVKEIGNQAASECSQLTSVTFEEGSTLRIIKTSAFSKCTSLTAIDIPDTVEMMEASVFHGCMKLELVKMPQNITVIEPFMFYDCRNLTSVNIPRSITSVGGRAFQNCLVLESIDLPDSITTIRESTFLSNRSLKSINVSQATTIGDWAFYDCRALETVSMPSVRTVGAKAFQQCLKLASIDMSVVEYIGSEAFATCNALVSVSLPSSLRSVEANSFSGSNAITAICADASLSDTGIAEAFSNTVKAKAVVMLPWISTDGNATPFSEMKPIWVSYNFIENNVVMREAALPLASDPEGEPNTDSNKASWKITPDGTLTIASTEPIADLGWSKPDGKVNETAYTEHWGSMRSFVKRVVMEPGIQTTSMAYWFCRMSYLTTTEGILIPEGTTDVTGLFERCNRLLSVHDGFVFPKSLTTTQRMFLDCWNLRRLADSFELPEKLVNANYMFKACYEFVKLPDTFYLPASLRFALGMFEGSALIALPPVFKLHEGLRNVSWMFSSCKSLASLPESFAIPQFVETYSNILGNCPSLTVLPPAFSMPRLEDASKMANAFLLSGEKKPLSYAGSDEVILNMEDAWWSDQGRMLITPQDGAAEFRLTAKSNASGWDTYTAMMPDVNGLVSDPSAPERTGSVFTLWYSDEECTKPYDFSRPLIEQATYDEASKRYPLYGVYTEGIDMGLLPTVGDVGYAAWSLSTEGTLYLRGNGTIADFGWIKNGGVAPTEGYWRPYANAIRAVAMTPSLDAVACDHWFSFMPQLVDVSQTHLPKSAVTLSRMFRSAPITTLPENMTMPSGVTNTHGMFYSCSKLTALPSGFALNDALVNANSMFGLCSKIEVLPAGFSLPSSLQNADWMFGDCVSLKSLPEGFTLPADSEISVKGLFQRCKTLASLPEGFAVPSTILNNSSGIGGGMYRMFYRCDSLSTLPDSFDFPLAVAESSLEAFYVEMGSGESRVPVYYHGNSQAVASYNWESQNRTLVTDASDAEGLGMQQAIFNLQVEQPEGSFVWKTSSTTWTNKQGILANPGAPAHPDGYAFTGWCTDEECLTPFDFTKPLTGRTTLYGKWIMHGGRHTAEGSLPVVGNKGFAWWRITFDGEMVIDCEDEAVIATFPNWEHCSQSVSGYWGPYRDKVKRVSMTSDVDAISTASWFYNMTDLRSTNGIFVPKSCTDTHYMFASSSIESIPSGFSLPTKLINMGGMFENCEKLTSVASDFVLPDGVKASWYLFSNTGITAIPGGVKVPRDAINAERMFSKCAGLTCIPEDFSIPSTVENVSCMFTQCPNLTVVPAKLLSDLAQLTPEAKETINDVWGMFGFPSASLPPENIVTYCSAPEELTELVYWSAQHRTLERTVPADKKIVTLLTPRADGTYDPAKPYATLMTDDADKILEPSISSDGSRVFAGWFIDADGNTAFDFGKTVAEQFASEPYVLYAKYVGRSGLLPTTDGGENASWKLTDDGTLVISCEPGATIASLGWDPLNVSADYEGTWSDEYWGPWRNHVKRIEMTPGVKTENMICWFAEMHNLVDVTGAYVPDGVDKVNRLFFRCTKLESIPEGFVFSEGVDDVSDAFGFCFTLKNLPSGFTLPSTTRIASHLFDQCLQLEYLPASFRLPEGLKDASSMFGNCSSLKSLPVGFTLPETVTAAQTMFVCCSSLVSLPTGFKIPSEVLDVSDFMRDCTALESLPEGFTVPDKATNTARMFGSCTSLKSLPESFTIPKSVSYLRQMFYNCPSLTALPASLDLSVLSPAARVSADTAFALPYAADPVVTVYAGSDLSMLGLDDGDAVTYWLSTFNRSLCTAADKPADVKTVSFVVADYKTGEKKPWMTVAVDDGLVKRPIDPAQFGYAFDGWYTDPGFAADSKVAFAADGTAPVDSDRPLYGRFVLSIDIDVPLAAKVEVDSSGNVTPAVFKMRSNTPVALSIASVSSEAASGAEKLFPNADERAGVRVLVKVNGIGAELVFGESKGPLSSLSAATASSPTMVDAEIGLNRNNAQLNFQPGEDITSFAKLTWTITPVL